MKVKELHIHRTAPYDTPPNTLVGEVTVVSDFSQSKIRLSNQALGRIFQVIAEEVGMTAKAESSLVTGAVQEAAAEPAVLEHFTIEM